MKNFNLSKYYTLNILACSSLVINFLYILYALFMFKIYLPYKCKDAFCYLAPYVNTSKILFVYLLFVIFLFILFLIELTLRKINKITKYNKLCKVKSTYTFFYWLGILLIFIDIIYFIFTLKLLLNVFYND